ncbi:MAG: hypothetical protein HYZ58_08990 [Acidobacteria bacterium]|nr:hypothetical protein [Acidobacteriota bacterium]
MKRIFLSFLLALASATLAPNAQQKPTALRPASAPFTVVEASIVDMRTAMEQGRTTSREIVLQYLARIAMHEDKLNAAITVNPRALEVAEERDRERAQGKIRGPLHGIPIALKDNIHTTDMPTTGGALAFAGLVPPYEATLTKNLRDAGAVIIAKTVMTELANWVASGMPGNYSAVGRYGMNPYDPRRDPREATADGRPALATGGSSSGIGTSANLWAANVGTETSGSILSPSNQNMLVGIKPTVGRISRYGIIPITADQDTAGPMAKTVTDAAILLGALEGAEPDANDPATKTCAPPSGRDYTQFLKPDGLKGARIGIPRASYYDKTTPPGAKEPRGGLPEPQAKVMALLWSTCGGLDNAKGKDADCSVVLKYGMKRDFNEWLKSLGPAAPVRTLTELRQWNVAHQKAGAIKYGQAQLDVSDEMDVDADRARHRADREKDLRLSATSGIDAVMKEHALDALLFPGAGGAAIAAKPGYPTVIVPFGFVPNAPTPPFPDGFAANPGPLGVAFTGTACSEPRLIGLAYAFEQATKRRVPPSSAPREPAAPRAAHPAFKIVEATIPEMRAAMEQGRLSSRELVRQYLARIAMYEDTLNASIAINLHSLEIADERDGERAQGKIRGPLHGIPIALKDNIHTTDMPTTGGALAFDGYVPPYEATLTKNLRDAGAIIIAKTGLTELANWVAGAPSPMPGNYNAVAGFGFNPYDPRRDPREATFDGRPALATGGSSSGVGTAASFWAGNVGSDTGGSIISPSNSNMLVGIRPTIGRISRYGVIPISADHDTAGPMTRTVADAAIMLGVLESPAPDPKDPATKTCAPPAGRDYTKFLNASGLTGARIGIPRAFYYDRITLPGEERPRSGLNAEQTKLMADAIGILKQQGAVIVDPADVPSFVDKDPKTNFLLWDYCSGADQAKGKDASCSVNFKYGMKRDFNTWLASLGPSAPVKTLTELRTWNLAHQRAGAIKYAQSRLDISDEMDLEADRPRFNADHEKDLRLSRDRGIDGVLKAQKLDAILTPGGSGAGLAARAGYPIIVVPFGLTPNAPTPPFPDGFNARPGPFGVGFTGAACSEPRLIELAYAFEQATKRRVPPSSVP